VLLRLKKKVPILSFSIELKSRKEICSCLDNKLNEVLSSKTLKCSGAIFTVKVLSKSISQTPKARKDKIKRAAKTTHSLFSHVGVIMSTAHSHVIQPTVGMGCRVEKQRLSFCENLEKLSKTRDLLSLPAVTCSPRNERR